MNWNWPDDTSIAVPTAFQLLTDKDKYRTQLIRSRWLPNEGLFEIFHGFMKEDLEMSDDQIVTLPFTVPNLVAGFAEGKGLAKASRSQLILEFVVKDTVLDLFKSNVREVLIPQPEIDAMRLKRGWFGGKVFMRFKSLKWLADLPGCDNGEVILHVARGDRDRAVDFVKMLSGA